MNAKVSGLKTDYNDALTAETVLGVIAQSAATDALDTNGIRVQTGGIRKAEGIGRSVIGSRHCSKEISH